MQEALEKLLTEYERNKRMLKDTGKPLAGLPPLQVAHLEVFTPRVSVLSEK